MTLCVACFPAHKRAGSAAQPALERSPVPPASQTPDRPAPAPVSPARELLARRGVGLAVALGLEVLLLLLLFSLGQWDSPPQFAGERVVTFDATSETEEAAEEPAPEPAAAEQASAEAVPEAEVQPAQPSALPAPPVPDAPPPMPPPAAVIPRPQQAPAPPAGPPRARAVIRGDQAIGPVDRGASGLPDSQRVGNAPNGQPLYAAAWYREPYEDELRGYLSTAQGPGWGLIACRTAPEWRVEDCEILAEAPQGSGIARAAAAAAWQFKVRPPRVGGEYRVGEWVRIRIDYQMRPAPRG